MLRSDDNLFDSVSLGDTYYITPSTLVKYGADFTMVAPVGHAFVDARIYPDDDAGSRLILIKQLAQPQFAMLSGFFC